MTRWINFTDTKGRDRLVTRNQALDLMAQGARMAGEKDGYDCIVAADVRVWKKRAEGPRGVRCGRREYPLGVGTMQLVVQ